MPFENPITADDKVFFDTDNTLPFRVWAGDPTAAEIAAGDATPLDVSAYAMSFTVRTKPNASSALIHKTTDPGGGIQVTGVFDPDPTLNTQLVEVTIEDTDTYDPDASPAVHVPPKTTYAYALKRTDEGSETILVYGSFTLLQAAGWE